jgi:hypothetical protein
MRTWFHKILLFSQMGQLVPLYAAGPLCAVISTPFELVKLQLQLDSVVGL